MDAALDVVCETGLFGSMEEIARWARVSKQTIYNHYGSKPDLVRALAQRRVEAVTASLIAPDVAIHPEQPLAAFAKALLEGVLSDRGIALVRVGVVHAAEAPDVGHALYEHGVRASRKKLADFLAVEHRSGRLSVPDAMDAAELFVGMVLRSYQTAALFGAKVQLSNADIEHSAAEAVRRFMRAYAG